MLERARFRLARRRRFTLLGAATLATLTAAFGLIGSRHERLAGGAFAHLLGDVVVLVWAGVLVVATFAGAVKPRPVRAGALGALLFGPFLMPLVFGPGGWRMWQIALLAAAAAGALRPPRSMLG